MVRLILLSIALLLAACGGVQVPKADTESISAIQSGLNRAFEKARCNGYTRNLSIGSYNIRTVEGELRNGLVVFRVENSSYANTEYDQGGFIYVTGQFRPPNTIVVPKYSDNFNQLSTAIEYEAEHKILYDNDKAKYERTKFHGVGEGHPLFSCN